MQINAIMGYLLLSHSMSEETTNHIEYLGNTILVMQPLWQDPSKEEEKDSKSILNIWALSSPTKNCISPLIARDVTCPENLVVVRIFLKFGGPVVSTMCPSPVPRRKFPLGKDWMTTTP